MSFPGLFSWGYSWADFILPFSQFDPKLINMDPVTHFAAGGLAGRSLAERFGAFRMFLYCAVAAFMPDLDTLVPTGAEGYLRHHRAFTHSIFGLPVLALILAAIFRVFWRDVPLRWLFWTGLGVMFLQVYLDLATTFGTMILWPVSDHRFAFTGVFIIDPLFTLALFTLLVVSLFKKSKRKILGVAGLALALAYPLFNWSVAGIVEARLQTRFVTEFPTIKSVEVTTDLLTPVYWKVVADDGERLWIGGVGPLPSLHLTKFETYPKADRGLLERLGRTASIFDTWQWFAQFPVIQKDTATPVGRRVTFLDLRFYSLSPLGRKIILDYEPPFTLEAVLDDSGKLTEWTYGRPGGGLVTHIPD
jgi:inner membrane protein